MISDALDSEIERHLPLLTNEEKERLLSVMNAFLKFKKQNVAPEVDYAKYRFPVSAIKSDRDAINE